MRFPSSGSTALRSPVAQEDTALSVQRASRHSCAVFSARMRSAMARASGKRRMAIYVIRENVTELSTLRGSSSTARRPASIASSQCPSRRWMRTIAWRISTLFGRPCSACWNSAQCPGEIALPVIAVITKSKMRLRQVRVERERTVESILGGRQPPQVRLDRVLTGNSPSVRRRYLPKPT